MARPHVPKFGNWENEESVPYTVYFEKARKDRKGEKIINPNDPEENPDLFSGKETKIEPLSSQTREPIRQPIARPMHEHKRSRENNELRQSAGSPYRYDAGRRAPSADPSDQHYKVVPTASGENQKRPTRSSAGSENSVDKSPLHPKVKVPGRGLEAHFPSDEGKAVYGCSHGTPGRSRVKSGGRVNDSPDRSAAVPRFGEWNESNPDSGDGYTQIFNKVREEKQTGGRTWAGTEAQAGASDYNYGVKRQTSDDSSKICCFSWFRK